jgi:hypothetical protein
MALRIPSLFQKSIRSTLLVVLVSSFAATTQHDAAAQATNGASEGDSSSRLVQIVQANTRQYADVNAAVAAGYGPFLGCVSGPDHGAMGI